MILRLIGGMFETLLTIIIANGAYTAYLNVNFKKPLHTPAVVVCRGRVQKIDGRKIYVKGTFEDKDGVILTEANGMWIAMGKNVGRSNVLGSKL